MPRLGRFLLGDWRTTSRRTPLGEDNSSTRFAVGYENRAGHRHERCVRLTDGRLNVMDEIGGFAHKAVLRWRLAPGLWRLEGETVINGYHSLSVSSSVPIVRMEIVTRSEERRVGTVCVSQCQLRCCRDH